VIMEAYAPDQPRADSFDGRISPGVGASHVGLARTLAARFDAARRPGWVITIVVSLVFLPSFFVGFIIDDYRALRLMAEYRDGARTSLDLYRFLDGQNNAAERLTGRYPWWISDGVRFRYWRPLGERLIYGQFLLFGRHAIGFHAASLALYLCGVMLVLTLFRSITQNERLSRWAALIYGTVPGHVLPVTFAAAQCDLWALILAMVALLSVTRFIRGGGAGFLLVAAAAYALGLGCKEAVLPCAVLPLIIALAIRDHRPDWRRAGLATGLLTAIGAVWLWTYMRGGYGADTAVMLDPLRAPAEYLSAFPGRALLLLSTALIPITPFVFYFEAAWKPLLVVYGVLGALGLVGCAWCLRRFARECPAMLGMAVWPLPFLPILVCTPPDDRVMMLPGIGLTFLAAICLTRTTSPRSTESPTQPLRVSRWAWHVFVRQQVIASVIAICVVLFLEHRSRRLHLGAMEGFGRATRAGDHIFFVGPSQALDVIFAQDCADDVLGDSGVRVSFLADLPLPRLDTVDERTIRLSSNGPGFLAGFLGDMGRTRGTTRREGEVMMVTDFKARIAEVRSGAITAVDLEFDEPLTSERYRFFLSSRMGALTEWRPAAPPR